MAAPATSPTVVEIETPHGIARCHLHEGNQPSAALVLGHGAGGAVASRDLGAATEAALSSGLTVALVEQPYRVAGRRSPAPTPQLDTAWTAVIERLRSRELADLPLVAGGRSAGARVACRTAAETQAIAVLCLAFPFVPPRRSGGTAPQSRLAELEAVTVPVLIVQGESDPFGMPPPAPGRVVVRVRGNHSLRTDLDAVRESVEKWLAEVVPRS